MMRFRVFLGLVCSLAATASAVTIGLDGENQAFFAAGDSWVVTTPTAALTGRVEQAEVATLAVDGAKVAFDANDATWSYELVLAKGLNLVTATTFDADGNDVDTAAIEVIYAPQQNVLTGELEADTILGGAWAVSGTVTVPAGVVLTVEPGTVMLMQNSAKVIVYGQLLASGTEAQPIRWTQYSTNVAWDQIIFIEAADSRFDHCLFEYADSEGKHQSYYTEGPRDYHEAIVVLACHLDVNDCTFRYLPDDYFRSAGDALAIISDDPNYPGEATANITGCQFLGIGQGVHTRYAYVLVEDCYFTEKRGDNDDVDLWGESVPAPLIRNNVFLNPGHDDMINPTGCSAIVIGNLVAGSDDHGIVLRGGGYPIVMNNIVYDCDTGGIVVENSCEALLINNTIFGCGRGIRLFDLGRWDPPYSLPPGGGIATVINCIIWDCDEPLALADSSNTEIEDHGSHLTIRYCDVQGGLDGVVISGTESTVDWGEGNIDLDPLFVDPNNADFHLRSAFGRWDPNEPNWVFDDVTSPCLDAGDPNEPLGDEPFPNGGLVNMGAYGGTEQASLSPNEAPVLDPIGEPMTGTSGAMTVVITATDPDGDALTYTAENLPAGATFVDQTFTWDVTEAESGTYEITFTVSDGALTDSATLTLAIQSTSVSLGL